MGDAPAGHRVGAATIAASGALGPQGIALNEVGRRAIMADPELARRRVRARRRVPVEGLSIARMIAMVTYHSQESMDERFGRKPATRPSLYPAFGRHIRCRRIPPLSRRRARAPVRREQSSLSDPRDGSVRRRRGTAARISGCDRSPRRCCCVGIAPTGSIRRMRSKRLADRARSAGQRRRPIAKSIRPHGHDAFFKEWDRTDRSAAAVLDRVARRIGRETAAVTHRPPSGPK